MSEEAKSQGIIALIDQYKGEESLRAFAHAQMKQITSLTKKVNELEKENKQLQKMLQDKTPVQSSEKSLIKNEGLLTTDEEAIAVMELNRLRDEAMSRPLTFEESKKADLFHKMLIAIRNKPKTIVVESKKLSTEELLSLQTSEEKE